MLFVIKKDWGGDKFVWVVILHVIPAYIEVNDHSDSIGLMHTTNRLSMEFANHPTVQESPICSLKLQYHSLQVISNRTLFGIVRRMVTSLFKYEAGSEPE